MSSSPGSSILATTDQAGSPAATLRVAAGDSAAPRHAVVFDAAIATLIAALFGYMLYARGSLITGPFIFPDELEYFLYGHDLFAGADLSTHTQYGILYPALLAVALRFTDIAGVYAAMRVFNIAVIASSVVPGFLLARALLPGLNIVWLLLSVFTATCAFSALADMIWAEPVYFTLFQWLTFSLFTFYRRPWILSGCVTGALLGLLFHAKPGAGVIVEFAAVISLVALLGDKARRAFPRRAAAMLAMIATFGALTLPWIARNLALGVGPIGYAAHAQELKSLVAEVGGFGVVKLALASSFYQLAYMLVATWGLLGVLVIAFVRWNALPAAWRGLCVFVLACLAGLIVLVSLGMRSDRDYEYWMPFGRYLSVVAPAIVILAVSLLRSNPPRRRREQAYVLVATLVLTTIAIWASPLTAIGPRIIVDAPDLALAMAIVDQGEVIARSGYDASILQRAGFAALLACLALLAALAINRRSALHGLAALVLAASLMASLAEQRFMAVLGAAQSPLNDAIRFLQAQRADLRHDVAVDRVFEQHSNIRYIADFWTAAPLSLRYLPADAMQDHGRDRDVKYFVSPEVLAFAVAFHAPGIYVYRLNGDARD